MNAIVTPRQMQALLRLAERLLCGTALVARPAPEKAPLDSGAGAAMEPDAGQPPHPLQPPPRPKAWGDMSPGEKVIALRARDGRGWVEIAAELGTTADAVRAYARLCGIKGPRADINGIRARAADEREAAVRRLVAAGKTAPQIAAMFGMGLSSLYQFAARRGIGFRRDAAAGEPKQADAETAQEADTIAPPAPAPDNSQRRGKTARAAGEREALVRRMVAEGRSTEDIAAATGATVKAIRIFAFKRQIRLPGGKPGRKSRPAEAAAPPIGEPSPAPAPDLETMPAPQVEPGQQDEEDREPAALPEPEPTWSTERAPEPTQWSAMTNDQRAAVVVRLVRERKTIADIAAELGASAESVGRLALRRGIKLWLPAAASPEEAPPPARRPGQEPRAPRAQSTADRLAMIRAAAAKTREKAGLSATPMFKPLPPREEVLVLPADEVPA
jgi:uncharacterized protein YerC